MPKPPYIALITVRGIVKEVEGLVLNIWGMPTDGLPNVTGMNVTNALIKYHDVGYDHFATEVDGEKNIYRLKLRP